FADPALGLKRRHAHVAGADFVAFDAGRDWTVTAQGAGSLLTGGDREVQLDGTVLRDGSSGFALGVKLSKNAGPVVGFVSADYLSPQFTVNDLGFMPRAN